MHAIFYSSQWNEYATRLIEIVEGLIGRDELDICRTVQQVMERLKKPQGRDIISVIVIRRKEELADLLLARGYLFNVRLVLILPDSDREAVAMAHMLRPRFLTYLQSDVRDLELVLERLLIGDGGEE